jgi:uncharacterized membrane protein
MTGNDPQAVPGSQAGNFHDSGRRVAAGRGWDWIAEGFALFRKQPGMWILTVVLLGVISIVIGTVPLLGSLANVLLFPIFSGGLMLACKDQDKGGALELARVFAGFKQKTGDLVLVGAFSLVGWAVIAIAVFVVVGGGVFMGIMRGGMPGAGISIASMLIALLLVTGLSLPLYMATWFAPALIVLHDLAPAAALKASFYACLRNWIPFLVYGAALLVACLIAAIPAFLGYLVLIPVLIASVYTAYRDIFCAGEEAETAEIR